MDIKWVQDHLLDKNGNVSRKKKERNLTQTHIREMQETLNFHTDDVNSLIYAYVRGIHSPHCTNCSRYVKVNKSGAQKFCSNACLNESDYMREKVSEAARANSNNKARQAEINEKRRKTNRRKYGVDHVLQIDGMGQRVKERSNPQRIETLQRKSKEHFAQYGFYPQQAHLSEKAIRDINDKDLMYDLYCRQELPLDVIGNMIGTSPSTISNKAREFGFSRARATSRGELELYEFVLSLGIPENEIVRQDRKVFSNQFELDLYIPYKNVAIEYNGIYWHSFGENDNLDHHSTKHQAKYQACAEKGITLLQFLETDWNQKQGICKSIISNTLGLTENRIHGRATKVEFIDTPTAREFLESNHINGYSNSKYKVGLYHGQELVSVMTFGKPRFESKYEYELVRLASKINTTVVGGASKMLSFFVREMDPSSIVTYSDLNYGFGNVYNQLGFSFVSMTKPGYCWAYEKSIIPRYKTQKSKLPHLLGDNFDPTLSESVNMMRNGARKLFDAGNYKYELIRR